MMEVVPPPKHFGATRIFSAGYAPSFRVMRYVTASGRPAFQTTGRQIILQLFFYFLHNVHISNCAD